MNLDLTPEQYEILLRSLSIATLIHSSQDTEDERSEILFREHVELEQYILSKAADFGKENLVTNYENTYYPARSFEENSGILEILSSYDNEVFWEELIHRMARRDFEREYTQEEISQMAIEEKMEKEAPFIERYEDLFEEIGIERLENS